MLYITKTFYSVSLLNIYIHLLLVIAIDNITFMDINLKTVES